MLQAQLLVAIRSCGISALFMSCNHESSPAGSSCGLVTPLCSLTPQHMCASIHKLCMMNQGMDELCMMEQGVDANMVASSPGYAAGAEQQCA